MTDVHIEWANLELRRLRSVKASAGRHELMASWLVCF
jgi:hypothetical protein